MLLALFLALNVDDFNDETEKEMLVMPRPKFTLIPKAVKPISPL